MNFLQYLKDRRYFLVFYFILMLFVSVMMLVSIDHHAMNNVLYTNLVCFIFICLYIGIGYFYKQAYYKEISNLIMNESWDFISAMPKSKNGDQDLFFALLKKLHNLYSNQLKKLHDEKQNHQDFIMSWIHEIKLPIASSKLIMQNSTGKTIDTLVDKLEDELSKIDHYVEQALYYSRIDSFSKDYFITEVQVNLLIKESLKKYAKLFINKKIRFHLDSEQQFIQTDSKWLTFIIDQIVGNSLKYTEEGGEIRFSFDEDSLEKRLKIIDTGIGIKSEDIRRVFDKGFTGSTGRNFAKSTGMGLYLAKQLALKLGHDLSIQSEAGIFTEVTIHFPKIRNYHSF